MIFLQETMKSMLGQESSQCILDSEPLHVGAARASPVEFGTVPEDVLFMQSIPTNTSLRSAGELALDYTAEFRCGSIEAAGNS